MKLNQNAFIKTVLIIFTLEDKRTHALCVTYTVVPIMYIRKTNGAFMH